MGMADSSDKRQRTDQSDMLSSLKDLLQTQHQQHEQAICAQLEGHKEEIREEMSEVKGRLDTLEERVSGIERRPIVASAPSSASDPVGSRPYNPCQVVVGGWGDNTKRADLAQDIQQLLQRAEKADFVEEVVVTGKRRSYMCSFALCQSNATARPSGKSSRLSGSLNIPTEVGIPPPFSLDFFANHAAGAAHARTTTGEGLLRSALPADTARGQGRAPGRAI